MKWIALILVTFLASASLALTPAEREFAEKAKGYVELAKEKARQQATEIENSNKANEALDQIAAGQQNQIITLSDQVDKAHDNEVALARYNAYAKPIIEQVNKYWGIGAFFYGAKVLSRHLLILIAVLAGVALAVFVLSFFFPFIIPFIRMVGQFLASIFRSIGNIFRKK